MRWIDRRTTLPYQANALACDVAVGARFQRQPFRRGRAPTTINETADSGSRWFNLGANVTGKRDFKVEFDGAYKVDFDGHIDWRDYGSSYAASYARLVDGSLVYVAERRGRSWSYGLWNPRWEWDCANLGACRNEIRRDFKGRIAGEGLNGGRRAKALHFANMEWGTNYAYRREQDFHDDTYERYGVEGRNDLLNYAVYFVYSNVHEHRMVAYVVERIGSHWLGARWDGASEAGGSNLREWQVSIWKHMTEWSKTSEYAARLDRYRRLMPEAGLRS